MVCPEARTHEVGPNFVGRRNSDILSPLPPSLRLKPPQAASEGYEQPNRLIARSEMSVNI